MIFCVGQNQILVSAFRAWATAGGIPFKSLKGSYRGRIEDSFIVAATNFPKVRKWADEQESVLHLGPCDARDRRPATLIYQQGGREHLGLFRACGRNEALARSSWTYDPTQDLYFVTSRREA